MTVRIAHICIDDDAAHQLLIRYVEKFNLGEFKDLYRELYPDASQEETQRCFAFIRLSLGLSMPAVY